MEQSPAPSLEDAKEAQQGKSKRDRGFEDKLMGLSWIAYAPTNFNPDRAIFPPADSIAEDLRVLQDAGFNGLVTYGANPMIHQAAQEGGFQGMILGVWDPTSREEIRVAKQAAEFDVVIGYVVGNEGLDTRYNYDTLQATMEELRQASGKPVTTTEEWGDYLDSRVLNLGDWVFPNVHPYWYGITDPQEAVSWTVERFQELATYTDKAIAFKEVGLPTGGSEGLSERDQATYYKLLKKTRVTFVYFEAYDQPWKQWAEVEPHWGLFRQDRFPKLAVSETPSCWVMSGPSFQQLPTDLLEPLARDTWSYLSSDWATDNHLPWSWRSAQIPGGDYSNPAEIGFYLLSYIGAYEMQKDWSPSWDTAEAEIGDTLNQLEAWQSDRQSDQPNGPNSYNNSVFYQAYWINGSTPVVGAGEYDHQVPSIDNAWLAASLMTIREYAEANNRITLVQQTDGVLEDMDFTLWYHPDQHQFSWGASEDPQGGGLINYYSNENRIINFVARALGQISEEEFMASLAALEQTAGIYDRATPDVSDDITVGQVNWDGSYFTYLAPALFIREMAAAYYSETINRVTEAQIMYARDRGYPVWGISDSFDVEGKGYAVRGAPPRGSSNPLNDVDDGLITPHASALALITQYDHEAVENLRALQGAYPDLYDDQYGFRDSVNVTTGKVSYRFSALAQGFIFLSLVNYLDDTIWRYFYLDEGVRRTHTEMYGSERCNR
ncbi:MAG: glucoamylase family protein [Dehalococcoidia bacterium]